MPQQIALGPGKLGLARGYHQKVQLSYLGLAIQPCLATGSSARGWVFILTGWTRLARSVRLVSSSENAYIQWVLMNSLSIACSLSEFIAFSRKPRKCSSFSCTFQSSKRHIRHAMCASYSIQYTSVYSPNLKLNLTKYKNPKNLKLQLKSSTLKFRQEKEKMKHGTYLDC